MKRFRYFIAAAALGSLLLGVLLSTHPAKQPITVVLAVFVVIYSTIFTLLLGVTELVRGKLERRHFLAAGAIASGPTITLVLAFIGQLSWLDGALIHGFVAVFAWYSLRR
jgi:hypothetical protein